MPFGCICIDNIFVKDKQSNSHSSQQHGTKNHKDAIQVQTCGLKHSGFVFVIKDWLL